MLLRWNCQIVLSCRKSWYENEYQLILFFCH